MDATFTQARIDATKLAIVAYEGASLAFATNGALQEYTIDTGQSIQRVRRSDLASIEAAIDGLTNRLVTLETRLNGGGTTHMRPAW